MKPRITPLLYESSSGRSHATVEADVTACFSERGRGLTPIADEVKERLQRVLGSL